MNNMTKPKMKKAASLLIAALLALSAYSYSARALASGYTASLSHMNSGVSVYMDHPAWGGVIHLAAPGTASTEVNEGRVEILLPDGTTLGDITGISWEAYTLAGYPPHADLILDKDGDGVADDSLTFEFAYQPYVGPGYLYASPGVPYGHYDLDKAPFYEPAYNIWVNTLQKSVTEPATGVIGDGSVAWLGSGVPGPYEGGIFGTLASFKAGTVQVLGGAEYADVDSDARVLMIHLEVDNWLGASEAYVDDVAVNGETLIQAVGPTVTVVKPTMTTYSPGDVPLEVQASDIFGVKTVQYNLVDEDGDWVYPANQTYTGPTAMSGLQPGSYTLRVWVANNLDIATEASAAFRVARLDVEVSIHPETLNLRSGGRWITVRIYLPNDVDPEELDIGEVRLWIGGKGTPPERVAAEDGYVVAKFSRQWVQERAPLGDEVEVRVTGELPGGEGFEASDTIRVINPGNGNAASGQAQNGAGGGPRGNQGKPQNSNGNGPKNGKNK